MNLTIKLDALFELFVGQIDNGISYYFLGEKNKRIPVKLLRMGMFDSFNGVIKDKKKIEQNELKLKKKKKNLIVKEMNAERCLQKTDYLICVRHTNTQPIVGYSLLNTDFGFPVCVSHHYIVVRPRFDVFELTFNGVYVPFLHLVLETLVENLAEQISNGTNKVISKSLLKKVSIVIPEKFEDQVKYFEQYSKLKEQINKSKKELTSFKKQVSEMA